MNGSIAALLGFVQGLTEFLPISSTGHLILVGYFLHVGNHGDDKINKLFDIIVQLGTVFSVVWYYRFELSQWIRGFFKKESASQAVVLNLGLSFIPAAVIGGLFHDFILHAFYSVHIVIYAMVGGGVLLLVSEKVLPSSRALRMDNMGFAKALMIGFCQCLAFIPGMSRSMSTIMGGRLVGLSAAEAARFSFLLSIPTMVGATGFALLKNRETLFVTQDASFIIGMTVAGITGVLVISGFLHYLKTHSLALFGWYRIFIGLILWLIV